MTAAILAFTLLTAALEPDVIYFNGKIVTVNEQFEIVEAVAIRDGRFVAGGSNEEVRALASPSTGLVDLEGQTVLPGFYEDHIHLGPSSRLQKWEQGYIPAPGRVVPEGRHDGETDGGPGRASSKNSEGRVDPG